jgi:hypothetical protein
MASGKAYEGGAVHKAAHSLSENSIIGLGKVFVAKSADAHSMAKMYGCFEPNAFPESRSIVGKCGPPGLLRLL